MSDVKINNDFYDKNHFQIVNVDSDGSCLYKCLIAYINYYSDSFTDNAKIKDLFNDDLSDKYYNENEDKIVFQLQLKLKNWLVDHADDKCEIIDDLTVGGMTLMMHEEMKSMEDYDKTFNIYAGAPDFIDVPTNELYKSGKNKGKAKCKKVPIPLRWGSTAELYAFNKIYGINIIQYMLIRYDKKKDKYVSCTLKAKEYKFKPIQNITNDANEETIHLLSFESNKPHYQLLI